MERRDFPMKKESEFEDHCRGMHNIVANNLCQYGHEAVKKSEEDWRGINL